MALRAQVVLLAILAAVPSALSYGPVIQSQFLGIPSSAEGSDQATSSYGPERCVKVQRSARGTCVLRTQCSRAAYLENVEFAFLCLLADGEVQKHTYGKGGFDFEEEFDTSVTCKKCLPPAVQLRIRAEPSENVTHAGNESHDQNTTNTTHDQNTTNKTHDHLANETWVKRMAGKLPVDLRSKDLPKGGSNLTKREAFLKDLVANHSNSRLYTRGIPNASSSFGPGKCIKTYVSQHNTCVIKTECKGLQGRLKDYTYGITCVDKDGKSKRHLFGQNSFNPEETFDTLIKCKLCLGLDTSKFERAILRAAVTELRDKLDSFKKDIANVTVDVEKLDKKVFTALNKTEQSSKDQSSEEGDQSSEEGASGGNQTKADNETTPSSDSAPSGNESLLSVGIQRHRSLQ